MQVRGARAIVTGGSQGIGLETARLLASKGARLSIVARDPAKLRAAAASIGGDVATAAADVTDAPALHDAIAGLGPCDLLVASAGAAHPGYFEQLPLDVFREQVELDYFGTLHAVRRVLPGMLERGSGGLVGIASAAALVGVFGYGAYAPAKWAVRGLMETLHAEYAHRGIYAACAFPPDTLTPGFEQENTIKPPETARVSASVKPRTAEVVAAAIVKGIERGRHVITADPQTAFLANGGAAARSIAYWQMARDLRPDGPL
ncbi:MAG TPA: SDR family oxidoreductase [Acidimicrobiia bacterium]